MSKKLCLIPGQSVILYNEKSEKARTFIIEKVGRLYFTLKKRKGHRYSIATMQEHESFEYKPDRVFLSKEALVEWQKRVAYFVEIKGIFVVQNVPNFLSLEALIKIHQILKDCINKK